MTLERYLVRRDTGMPDLQWVAKVELDTATNRGVLRHSGALGGLREPIVSRAGLESVLADSCSQMIGAVPMMRRSCAPSATAC